MNTTMNMEKLEQDAADIFHQVFACSESVIYAIRKHFGIDLSDDAIAMSSGFPWGLGGRRLYLWRSGRRYDVYRLFLREAHTRGSEDPALLRPYKRTARFLP